MMEWQEEILDRRVSKIERAIEFLLHTVNGSANRSRASMDRDREAVLAEWEIESERKLYNRTWAARQC